MKKVAFLVALLFVVVSGVQAQGIKFFEGTFEQALKAAQDQNKKVFVDFYATWCGPCKQMAREAFPDAKVGEYFNSKFISCQFNAEDAAMKEVVAKYNVKAYPTVVILDATGEEIASVEGAMNAEKLLKWAKNSMGDVITYEQIYERFKTDKSDDVVRDLLLGAPDFLATQQGTTRERWTLRVERIYADYRKAKSLAELMNPADFRILMIYHSESSKDDAVTNYIMANYDDVVSKVGADNVNQYIFSLNTLLIQDLAQKGDMDYEKYLDRIRGDMKPIYDAMLKTGDVEPYTIMKYLNDGLYYIYNRKNVEKYIELTDEYLVKLGDQAKAGDYSAAIQTLYQALDGKLPPVASAKGVEWIGKALQYEAIEPGERMELMIMMGDCYKAMNDIDNAKKCYNQAYVVSLQFDNPGLSAQIKNMMSEF